ncbi:MAG: PD-(D/E)XK nuclease family protein, partial [Anaerolineales bacterium]
ALDARLRNDQQTLFYEAVTRASEYLLLTRAYLADDGERWEASPYWNAALSLFATEPVWARADSLMAEADAASPHELLITAARAGVLPAMGQGLKSQWRQIQHGAAVLRARQARQANGPFDGDVSPLAALLGERFGPDHIWSASRLETYGECHFRFFVDRGLSLELRLAPAAGFDVAQLGGMLHTVLEQVYQQAPDPSDVAGLLASLPAVAGAVFAAAPLRHGFRPSAVWDAQQAEWQVLLAQTLTALGEAAEAFRPAYFEVRFGFDDQPPLVIPTAAGPIRFHGVIDRVDANAQGGLRLIDYKTGASAVAARDVGEGRRLQLPLYARAAEQVLGGTAVEGFYWGIRQGKASPLRLSKFAYPTNDPRSRGVSGAIDVAVQHASAYVRGIRAGEFAPQPPPGGCPSYCAARLFCWRYAPRSAR